MVQPGGEHSPAGPNGVAHGQEAAIDIHAIRFKRQGFDVQNRLSREGLHEFQASGFPVVGAKLIKPAFQCSRGEPRCEWVSPNLARGEDLTD